MLPAPTKTLVSTTELAIYERPGDGMPVVFVHGISSSAQVYERIWDDPSLAGLHLIAFDLPGHGNSNAASDISEYAIMSLSKLVAEVINQKKLQDVIVVAHSIGGHLAIHALRFTNRIKGIMIVGSAPCDNAASVADGYVLSEDILPFFKANATDAELSRALPLEALSHADQDFVRKSYRNADGRVREIMAKEIGTFFGSESFVSEVALLQQPGLHIAFVLGAHERLINNRYVEGLPIKSWKGVVHFVDNSAHSPMLERPVEFARLVGDFVRGF